MDVFKDKQGYSFRLLLAEISLYHRLIVVIGTKPLWSFRLLLAEISLYHSAKADLNKANSLVFVSFWRRSVYIGHTTYKPSNQLESFRLLLAEISLYHNMKLDLNFIKDMFSSPSGGDQFISETTYANGQKISLVFVSFWRRSVYIRSC